MRRSLAIAILLFATAARADGDRHAARAAYEAGTQAFHRGDFTTAATRYAEADALAPSPVALQAALDAAVKADDPVLGAELLVRARGREQPAPLAASVRAATVKLAHRAGRVTATCPSACTVALDGNDLATGRPKWVALGAHEIVFDVGGRLERKSIDVAADANVSVQPTPPPLPPAPVRHAPFVQEPAPRVKHARGASPALFWASLGATGAVAVASAVLLGVTVATHDRFMDETCATSDTASCHSLATQGFATMATGDALLGLSIAGAIWTVIAGAALVRWRAHAGASVSAQGVAVFWRMDF